MPGPELSIEDVIRKVGEIGIVPVVRASSVEEANRAVEAICAGGIPVVEITMTVPNALDVVRQVRQTLGDRVLLGAGTILDTETARAAILAGRQAWAGFRLPPARPRRPAGNPAATPPRRNPSPASAATCRGPSSAS